MEKSQVVSNLLVKKKKHKVTSLNQLMWFVKIIGIIYQWVPDETNIDSLISLQKAKHRH